MQARNCSERILNLKKWRLDNGKTVDQCVALFDGVPSDSTIKKVLGKGSENKSFRESTIAAMELKMMGHVYSPQIAIPVEDVIRAQEAVVRPLVEESKKKSEEIKLRDRLIAVLLFFDAAFLIFDLSIKTGGFFNSKTLVVWVIEAVVVLAVAVILFVYKKRKKGEPE